MRFLFITFGFLISISSFAQNIVTAEKNSEGADLCFHRQVQLKGYAYANIIGRCAWDPGMNGMNLTLVAVPEDPTEEAHTLTLDYIRDVKVVQNESQQLQITVVQDNFDANENIIQKKKVIYVRAVDPKKAQFSLKR